MATVEQRDAALAEFANKVKAEYFEEGATIDYDKLRRPGIFSRFLWMGEHAHRAYMYAQVAKESTYAGRKVTATEVDALTEHMDWAWRTRAMAQPLSLLLAGYMTWRSRKVWKFPFVTARPTFNPNVFPSERMPFLVGPAAWATWHFVRYICYAPPSWFVTQWAVSEMAVGGYEKSKREDPRLRELMQQIKVARQAELAKRFAGARPGGQREGAQGQPSQSDMRYPRQQQQQQQSQQPTTYRDDASPTNSSGAGSETWGNVEPYAEKTSYSSSSASPSARPPATSYGQQPPSSSLPPTPSYSQPSQGSQASSEGNSGWAQTSSAFDNNSSSNSDDFDDMSPVSPAARRQEAASASRSGGSAWDRIRQQQGGQSQPSSQQQQQQHPAETSSWSSSSSDNSAANTSGSVGGGWGAVRGRNNNNSSASSGESYTYSAADEERESRMYEKEKAQKEFDAMVERERNGQGASGGSNDNASRGGKGWWN